MTNKSFEQSLEAPAREAVARSLQNLDHTVELTAPLMKSMMMFQMHMTGFAVKRARAMMALPRQAASCRSPQDVMALNMSFWQTAMTQYVEASSAAFGMATPKAPTKTRRMPTRKAAPPSGNVQPAAGCVSTRDVVAFPTERVRDSGVSTAPDA